MESENRKCYRCSGTGRKMIKCRKDKTKQDYHICIEHLIDIEGNRPRFSKSFHSFLSQISEKIDSDSKSPIAVYWALLLSKIYDGSPSPTKVVKRFMDELKYGEVYIELANNCSDYLHLDVFSFHSGMEALFPSLDSPKLSWRTGMESISSYSKMSCEPIKKEVKVIIESENRKCYRCSGTGRKMIKCRKDKMKQDYHICIEHLIDIEGNRPRFSKSFHSFLSQISEKIDSDSKSPIAVYWALLLSKIYDGSPFPTKAIKSFKDELEYGEVYIEFANNCSDYLHLDVFSFNSGMEALFPSLDTPKRIEYTLSWRTGMESISSYSKMSCETIKKELKTKVEILKLFEKCSNYFVEMSNDMIPSCETIYCSIQCDNIGYLTKSFPAYTNILTNQNIRKIKSIFSYYRSIRGDGNCYYRSIVFALIEQAIVSGNRSLLLELAEKFEEENIASKFLFDASENLCWKDSSQLEVDILSNKELDLSCIRACRNLLSKYIISNREMKLDNDMTLEEAMKTIAMIEGKSNVHSLEECCQEFVEKMNEDVRDMVADSGILFKALQCRGFCVLLNNAEYVQITSYNTNCSSNFAPIYLLYMTGHYELIYIDDRFRDCSQNGLELYLNKSFNVTSTFWFEEMPQVQITPIVENDLEISRQVQVFCPHSFLSNCGGLCTYDSDWTNDLTSNNNEIRYGCWACFDQHDPKQFESYFNVKNGISKNISERKYMFLGDQIRTFALNIEGLTEKFSHKNHIVTAMVDCEEIPDISSLVNFCISNLNFPSKCQIVDVEPYTKLYSMKDNTTLEFSLSRNVQFSMKGEEYSIDIVFGQDYNTFLERLVKAWKPMNAAKSKRFEWNDFKTGNRIDYPFDGATKIEVIYCKSRYPRCKENIQSKFLELEKCDHQICYDCVDLYLNENRSERELLDLRYPGRKTRSLFSITKEGDKFVPKLNPVRCPVQGCSCQMSSSELSSFDAYTNGYYAAVEEIEVHAQQCKRLVKCGLSDLLCGSDKELPELMISTACDHYFHRDCLRLQFCSVVKDCKIFRCPIEGCDQIIGYDIASGLWEDTTSVEDCTQKHKYLDKYASLLTCHELSSLCGPQEKLLKCDSCSNVIIGPLSQKSFTCETCHKEICCECSQEIHEGITCQESKRVRQLNVLRESGFTVIQLCPNCNYPWSVPVDCLHATCEVDRGGCGHQFCYLCLAPHLPIVGHDNSFHYIDCSFYSTECQQCTAAIDYLKRNYPYADTNQRHSTRGFNRPVPIVPPQNFSLRNYGHYGNCTQTTVNLVARCESCQTTRTPCARPVGLSPSCFTHDEVKAEEAKLNERPTRRDTRR